MTDRIKALYERVVKGEMFVPPVPTEYDKYDLFLSPVKMSGKRVCEYILNQDFLIPEEACFTGLIKFDESVEGDIFTRAGHKNFRFLDWLGYNQPIDGLVTFEWQHSVGDFGKIINRGLAGILNDIEKSMELHKDDEKKVEFLETQRDFCNTLILRAQNGSKRVLEAADKTDNPEYKKNLKALSDGLLKVPKNPAESFYEAVLSLYFCYSYIPDSIGLIDRYLYPYYKADLESGALTKERAIEYLQELFMMLQARISIESDRFYRGGESHFCIGGYLPDGSDGFNDFSELIVEALLDLPIWIPQITLRWTQKTPKEVLRFMLESERKDPHKRIAFVNDEPRIKGLMKYQDLSFEEAVGYTMMGCNEIALPGGMVFGFDMFNFCRCVQNSLYNHQEELEKLTSFDEFYAIFEKELFNDLDEYNDIGGKMQSVRSRDCNIVSNIFLEGPVKRGKSCTQGGLERYIAVGVLIGISNVFDSLTVIKQFVFDEKSVSFSELLAALNNNWEGFEDLRNMILKKAEFFGNDKEISNLIANRVFASIEKWNTGDNYLNKKWVFGNLVGYNEHNKFFGERLKATPDGRKNGDMLSFGIGQTDGKDRNGISALLNSVAHCDPGNILTGPSVTNLMLDKKIVENDDSFIKLVDMLETYFKEGGTHFQLTYVDKQDLINAQITPEKYKSLRVRVSGFSDYFVLLNKNLQDEIILRTSHNE